MSTKIDHTSAVEPHHTQTTVTAKASATPTSSPKISMFAAKSGFVIPKNKLSGSLIPIYRGGKKPGGSDEVNDESIKQGQRKTKWGPDLTQDTAVRKGRAVAYQIRIDQITKELSSRILEKEDNEDLQLAGTIEHHRNNSENSEFLELERREAIGEIMKLNPSYKPPADYKPLLKEAKVLVPIKDYPGYNFIGLIFGPSSATQKRLEKETGARIQVYGTKADKGEKSEIMPSDGNEAHYEELYVRISADTYEKVDAAVALIELLVTPVSVNPTVVSTTSTPVSGDNANVVDQSQGMATPYLIPPAGANQEVVQSNMQSSQNQPQIQFQSYHPGSWFPPGTSQSSLRPPSGFTFLPNSSSAPVPINPALASSNMPSLFGPGPVQPSGLGSVLRNQPLFLSRSQLPVLQRPFLPQASIGHAGTPINPSVPAAIQPSPAQPSISAPPPFTGNQPMVARPPPVVRPLGPSPSQAVSRPTTSGLLPPDRPLTPAAGSSTQSQAVAATTLSLGLGSMTPPIAPRGPQPIIIASGTPPPNISSMNMVSPVSYPSRPEPLNHSIVTPAFTFGPQPQTRPPPQASSVVPNPVAAPTSAPRPLPIQSSSPVPPPMQPLTPRALSPNPSPNPLFGSMPIAARPPPLQAGILGSVSASTSSFTVIQSPPTLTAPKQLSHPNSGDFTFQPHRPQNLASQAVVPRPDPMAQPPLAPSFQPAMHGSSSPTLVQQGFPRPPPQHLSNQMNQTHSQISPFARNPTTFTTTSAPPRHPHVPQMVGPPRNASPGPPHAASGGPFPPPPPHGRPGSSLRQQNYPPPAAGGWRMLGPNQHARAVSSNPGEQQQIYDPFSPTSASIPPLSLPARTRKQENNDPEYEDLMASVGVK